MDQASNIKNNAKILDSAINAASSGGGGQKYHINQPSMEGIKN